MTASASSSPPSETGTGYRVSVIDLARPHAKARILAPGFNDRL